MGKGEYGYVVFDGDTWYTLYDHVERMDTDIVLSLAAKEVANWDYGGISQRLDVYETSDEDVYGTKIGAVETLGRMYQCPTCHGIYPHPPQELAVCKCGHVGSAADLIGEDYT